jgi:beta-glucosidase
VLYSEDVYVGYRWYDTLDIEPLFPFGHGLSYTNFAVSNLEVEASNPEEMTVKVQVKNTGAVSGAEVVQVYIAPAASTPLNASPRETITRPSKELKGFAKVHAEPGATEHGEIKLDILRATSYWSEMEDCWRSDAGEYGILVGTSSRGAFLETSFVLQKTRRWKGLRA